MTQSYSTFTPNRLRKAVCELLSGITHANGYQTQPLIVSDLRMLKDGISAKHMLLVAPGAMAPTVSGVPLRWEVKQAVIIIGQTMPGPEDPQDLADALLQDVLNALTSSASITTLITRMGKGFSCELGSVEIDAPYQILEDGLLCFTVTMTCGFQQTPPW